jgi:hypothetical protein
VVGVGEGEPLEPLPADDVDEDRGAEVDGHARHDREEADA